MWGRRLYWAHTASQRGWAGASLALTSVTRAAWSLCVTLDPHTRDAPLGVTMPGTATTSRSAPATTTHTRTSIWGALRADESLSQALASWFSAEMAPVRYRHRRSEYGRAIADLWSEWERTGRIKNDPEGCQIDHVRAVQEHILGARRRGLWQEPRDLDRYDFPWYARLSMTLTRIAVPAIVLGLTAALAVMTWGAW